MTEHTDLIERLTDESYEWSRYVVEDRALSTLSDYLEPHIKAVANALEAQAREIAELKAQLAATAKNAFEAMPHDIPQRMKDAICEETGWSGSMVSRMYTELRKAFTGEPYRANEDLDSALLEIEALKAQEAELCTLYGLAQAECKKLRAELERTANNRDMWKSQCERQADELRKLRKDAERVFTYKNQPCDNVIAWRFGEACRAAQPGGDPIDHGLSLLQKLQEKGYGIVAIDAAKEGQP